MSVAAGDCQSVWTLRTGCLYYFITIAKPTDVNRLFQRTNILQKLVVCSCQE